MAILLTPTIVSSAKFRPNGFTVGRVLMIVITLFASAHSAANVIVRGSDSVEPVFRFAITDFKRSNPKAIVNIDAKGTGAGFSAICTGEVDIAMASRKINSKEFSQCGLNSVAFYELPIGWDAIAILSHQSNSGWLTSLTLPELTQLFEVASTEKVLTWNQIRPSFPATKITLIGLDARSGSADFLSTSIKGFAKMLRADMRTESDHARVARIVASTPGAVGFASLTGVTDANVSLVAIDEGKGAIEPSAKTVLSGEYGKLSRLIYVYVAKTAYDTKPEVKVFLDFTLSAMAKYVRDAGALPLTGANYDANRAKLREKKTGTE